MNNKKAKVFLYVGLICFLLTTVGVIIDTKLGFDRIQEAFANDPNSIRFETALMQLFLIWVMIPGLAVELSGIRSTYKLLKHKPKGTIKICYLISASLAFLAIAFVVLCCLGMLNLDRINPGMNFTFTMVVVTMWPSFIISFILGSIPIKRNKEDNV